jgi:ubiquinone/menaquinone biosynthesis C-methylase UbiE
MAFKDHFSGHARDYAEFRPNYPADLAGYLAGQAPGRHLAWDCGTGNGQAAILLGEHFERVVATDPSRQQLRSATPHPKVFYVAATAERTPLADGSVDLITVAQALHWFDFDRFYDEVRRVSRPGAIFAAWCYELARISPEVDRWVEHYYHDVVGKYWPPERRYIEEGYRTIPFPFAEIQPLEFTIRAEWSLDEFLGYLSTWSAGQRASRELGYDVLRRATTDANGPAGALPDAWGTAERRLIVWPLILRAGRL